MTADLQARFAYSVLDETHAEQTIACLCTVFSAQEPLGKAIGISSDELTPFVTDLVHHAIKTQLSWVAIEKTSSRLVGVRILTDFHNDFIPGDYESQKLNTIFAFLESLYEFQHSDEENESKPLLHCWMTAVLPAFQRQGILRSLYRAASLSAIEKGFRFGISEVTSPYNLAFLESDVTVKKLNTLHYTKYQKDGVFPFSLAEDSELCVLCRYPLVVR
ncbi:hypothetical protein [Serratia plymuthica]|uniref:hypothetical protein n=1 Tax=Serratia plymuthica TaxID=82996 RepID=UPI0018D9D491|nr:hypothetical protein [Serratia plymuthica]QPS56680.1 hypothetical protein I6G53_03845 [Serratia plymuthica]CAI1741320.1 Uncharacterised protein [Serratia plymuthica]